eukprot:1793389-Pleurochrysis_carterae.AAC.1
MAKSRSATRTTNRTYLCGRRRRKGQRGESICAGSARPGMPVVKHGAVAVGCASSQRSAAWIATPMAVATA